MIPSRSKPSPASAGFGCNDALFASGGVGFAVDGAGAGAGVGVGVDVGGFGFACGACGGGTTGSGAGGMAFGFGGASPVKPWSSACKEERVI